MKRLIFCAVILLLLCMSYYLGSKVGTSQRRVVSDTVMYVDTVTYRLPVAMDSAVVRYVRVAVRVDSVDGVDSGYRGDSGYSFDSGYRVDSGYIGDSVVLPITQKVYSGVDYCAWVSGYQPCLDSIRVFRERCVVRERVDKPPGRWHIGITGGVGYGFGSRKAEPYIGVGIMYSIISF